MSNNNSTTKGLGRRKEAVANVSLTGGKGAITINQLPLEQYFAHFNLQSRLLEPLKITNLLGKFDIKAKVTGGGKSGQADACKLAIAKAIVEINPEMRSTLKRAKLLSRDSRVKERKKYGLKRARKAAQFTKR